MGVGAYSCGERVCVRVWLSGLFLSMLFPFMTNFSSSFFHLHSFLVTILWGWKRIAHRERHISSLWESRQGVNHGRETSYARLSAVIAFYTMSLVIVLKWLARRGLLNKVRIVQGKNAMPEILRCCRFNSYEVSGYHLHFFAVSVRFQFNGSSHLSSKSIPRNKCGLRIIAALEIFCSSPVCRKDCLRSA